MSNVSLETRFEMTTITPNAFLSFQKQRGKRGEALLHQTSYINTIMKRFNMHESYSTDNPIIIDTKRPTNTEDQALDPKVPYREAIGSLMYAAQQPELISHMLSA